MDYTPQMEIESTGTGFARLFVNDLEHCFAEVNQAFPGRGRAIPMCGMIVSFLDDGWSLSTGNREPTKEFYILRRPRAAWTSMPGEAPDKLLKAHLELRQKMTRSLKVEVLPLDTANDYFAQEKQAARQRKQTASAAGPLPSCWTFGSTTRIPCTSGWAPSPAKQSNGITFLKS